jgi:hypothetical protein
LELLSTNNYQSIENACTSQVKSGSHVVQRKKEKKKKSGAESNSDVASDEGLVRFIRSLQNGVQ